MGVADVDHASQVSEWDPLGAVPRDGADSRRVRSEVRKVASSHGNDGRDGALYAVMFYR